MYTMYTMYIPHVNTGLCKTDSYISDIDRYISNNVISKHIPRMCRFSGKRSPVTYPEHLQLYITHLSARTKRNVSAPTIAVTATILHS